MKFASADMNDLSFLSGRGRSQKMAVARGWTRLSVRLCAGACEHSQSPPHSLPPEPFSRRSPSTSWK
eukprot:2090209-Rhodomonas_salina.1